MHRQPGAQEPDRPLGAGWPQRPPASPPDDLPGPPRENVPMPAPPPLAGQPAPRPNSGVALMVFGVIGVLAGVLGPRLPAWYHNAAGQGISLDEVHALCSSGAGLLASGGDASVLSRCQHADLYSGVLLAVLIGGAALLLAGVILWAGRRVVSGKLAG